MDTLINLKTFLRVATVGSFSQAARELDLSVSVVKKRIDQLEHEVGAVLFERSTRRLSLTDAGQRQVPAVRDAVRAVDAALAGFGDPTAALEGHLRVKVPSTLGRLYLMDLLTEFRRDNPGISLEVVAMDRAVNPVREGFDVAVGVTPGSHAGVKEIAIRQIRRFVVAAPAYLARHGRPATPKALQDHETLNFQPLGDAWDFERDGVRTAVRLRSRLSSNDGEELLRAALAGEGIAFLSEYLVAGALRNGDLVPLLEEYETPAFWIYLQIPQSLANLARVRSLVGHLRRALVRTPPWECPEEGEQAG